MLYALNLGKIGFARHEIYETMKSMVVPLFKEEHIALNMESMRKDIFVADDPDESNKFIKFNYENRRKAAKNRAEIVRVSEWLRSSLERIEDDYSLQNKQRKLSIIEGEEESLLQSKTILELFNDNFKEYFYKRHFHISYAFLELRDNIQASCKERGSLLNLLYEEILGLFGTQSNFILEFWKKIHNIHLQNIKNIKEAWRDRLEIKESELSFLKLKIDDNNRTIKKIRQSQTSMKSRLASYHYWQRTLQDDLSHANDLLAASEKEKLVTNSVIKGLMNNFESKVFYDLRQYINCR